MNETERKRKRERGGGGGVRKGGGGKVGELEGGERQRVKKRAGRKRASQSK